MFKLRKLFIIGVTVLFAGLFLFSQQIYWKRVFRIDLADIVRTKIGYRNIYPSFGSCKDCNVIIISLDTLRAQDLPCYGYNQNTSPNLCNFAGKSLLFKNVYSQSSYTLDSHFSIITSLYPQSHKMTIPFQSNLNDQVLTLPQILSDNGYYSIYSGPTADYNLPLDKGFGRGYSRVTTGKSPDDWIKTLDNYHDNGKFFAFLHTYWVHAPYFPSKENVSKFYDGPVNNLLKESDFCFNTYKKLVSAYPERFVGVLPDNSPVDAFCEQNRKFFDENAFLSVYDPKTKYINNLTDYYFKAYSVIDLKDRITYLQSLYDARIYELDVQLQFFLDYLQSRGLLKKTIIVITSDHGESFYEHGSWEHSQNLYNEVLHVPLIIYVPDVSPDVSDNLVESIDIAPSVLSLLGINSPAQFQGLNMFSGQIKDFVISQHRLNRKYAIVDNDWKLIINNDSKVTKELYDLKKDYGETVNLIDRYPDVSASMENSLNSILFAQPVYEQKNNRPFPTWIDEKQRKKLIETGYF